MKFWQLNVPNQSGDPCTDRHQTNTYIKQYWIHVISYKNFKKHGLFHKTNTHATILITVYRWVFNYQTNKFT